jgi:hypothetical protein
MNRKEAIKLMYDIRGCGDIDYYDALNVVNKICTGYEEQLKELQYKLECQESIIKELMEYKFMYEGLAE